MKDEETIYEKLFYRIFFSAALIMFCSAAVLAVYGVYTVITK